ncbi:ribonuclease E/G [Neobacillus piezotolerans]|uniref:Ribonuclease E/G n=1 Tax=Neobacillus piezotolerans TaxID=2259171 RepID=A0A3D8GLF5_9BACI|nr:Rne/Rng family ribonuclease [Neobacillus piezotolerans]RDU35059.1 ribonuclease E/G [Neobacillus piezotolerans]
MDKLIINSGAREKRAALFHNGKIEQLKIARAEGQSLVGSIFLGIVTKVLPGMNAAFIDIGTGKNAYLHRDSLADYAQSEALDRQKRSISSFVRQGERLLVQAEKDEAGTKGAKVTGIIEVPGENLVYMPSGNYIAISKKIADPTRREELRGLGEKIKVGAEGILFRTSAGNVPDSKLIEEIDGLRAEAGELFQKASSLKKAGVVAERDPFIEQLVPLIEKMAGGEVVADDPGILNLLKKRAASGDGEPKYSYYSGKENIFALHGADQEIGKLMKRVVWLENGAYLLVEETETLTAIDVNTGKFSGKRSLDETVLKTNLLAASEAARQIRLRDLAGIILIDFIDMKTEDERAKVAAKMADKLRKDGRRTRVVGFTSLGILQITRKRLGPSLSGTLATKCPSCEGTGWISSPETEAFRLERELWEHRGTLDEAVLVETSPEVKVVFEGDGKVHLKRIEESLGFKILIAPVESAVHFYTIRQFGDADELRKKADNTY